jgi:putative phosphoribosyl transferase
VSQAFVWDGTLEHMYFESRTAAGKTLAEEVAAKYADKPCAVVALSDGGVMVGAQIALKLHAVLGMLLTEPIKLPREDEAVAGISESGSFAYNNTYEPGEIEEFISEYRGYIEEQKFNKMSEMHRVLGGHGLIRPDLLENKHVILVSDGLSSGFSLDVALEFLKPISIKKLIVATPFASVPAVDRMHILADDIYCLNVLEDYISTDHYYEKNDVPPHEVVVKTLEEIMAHWQ